MTDYFGREYEPPRKFYEYLWWRPYQERRVPAIRAWIVSTVERLTALGHNPQVRWGKDGKSEPITSSDYASVVLPAIPTRVNTVLTPDIYDTLQKSGVDPAEWVIITAKGQKHLDDLIPDRPKQKH